MPRTNKNKPNKSNASAKSRRTSKVKTIISTAINSQYARPPRTLGKSRSSRRQSRRADGGMSGLKMSPCAWKWARALIDPFNTSAGACVPCFPANPSFKYKASLQAVMKAGSDGNGWILINPFKGCCATGITAVVTDGSAASNTAYTSTVGVGQTGLKTNSPLSSAFFGVQIGSAKLVAAGVRIRYIGAAQTAAGLFGLVINPNHSSLNAFPLSSALNIQNTNRIPVDSREWVNLTFSPVDSTDFNEYVPGFSAAVTNDTQADMMAIQVTGAAAGAAYEVEFAGHYEAFGQLVPAISSSMSDPQGASVVQAILAAQTKVGWIGDYLDTGYLWNQIQRVGINGLSSLANYAIASASRRMMGANVSGGQSVPRIEEMP